MRFFTALSGEIPLDATRIRLLDDSVAEVVVSQSTRRLAVRGVAGICTGPKIVRPATVLESIPEEYEEMARQSSSEPRYFAPKAEQKLPMLPPHYPERVAELLSDLLIRGKPVVEDGRVDQPSKPPIAPPPVNRTPVAATEADAAASREESRAIHAKLEEERAVRDADTKLRADFAAAVKKAKAQKNRVLRQRFIVAAETLRKQLLDRPDPPPPVADLLA